MKVSYFVSKTPFKSNCYAVLTKEHNAVIIDAPMADLDFFKDLDRDNIQVKKILLTHGHCDHIESLAYLAKRYNTEVYIHERDEAKLHDDELSLYNYFRDVYDKKIEHFDGAITVSDGDIIEQDEVKFKVMHTPGHTSGSVCFVTEDAIFSGDTLFRMSVGRTDMIDGDYNDLRRSLQKLDNMKGEYMLFPGHGASSSLFEERCENPYMKGFDYDDMF
jgi:glyoxylase-like metal-dependent hydrolase (beta-lactamase superfamily II)